MKPTLDVIPRIGRARSLFTGGDDVVVQLVLAIRDLLGRGRGSRRMVAAIFSKPPPRFHAAVEKRQDVNANLLDDLVRISLRQQGACKVLFERVPAGAFFLSGRPKVSV